MAERYIHKPDRDVARRVREAEEQIEDLTVGDVGEDVAIKLAVYVGDGISEENLDRVEELLAEGRSYE